MFRNIFWPYLKESTHLLDTHPNESDNTLTQKISISDHLTPVNGLLLSLPLSLSVSLSFGLNNSKR